MGGWHYSSPLGPYGPYYAPHAHVGHYAPHVGQLTQPVIPPIAKPDDGTSTVTFLAVLGVAAAVTLALVVPALARR